MSGSSGVAAGVAYFTATGIKFEGAQNRVCKDRMRPRCKPLIVAACFFGPIGAPSCEIVMKKALILFVILAAGGWGVWYFFVREKTLGEKIDDASHKVEKSVNDAVKKISR